MAKNALGKGLSALMADSEQEVENSFSSAGAQTISGRDLPAGITADENGILYVDIDLLKPNPHQPRIDFESDALDELAESIREHGIIQPVTIEDAGDGSFYIIAGERRTRAARIAGITKIPVLLRQYSDERKLEVALIENIQREDLNPIEEALAYRKLMEMENLSQDEVARRVGKNRSTVANVLRLLKLPEDMQTALAGGSITAGHARALLSVINPADQRVLFARIIGSEMSVRDAEQYAVSLNAGGRAGESVKEKTKSPQAKNPEIAAIEQEFIDSLGTKVTLKGSLERGSIQIEYFSREDLDRLYELIRGN